MVPAALRASTLVQTPLHSGWSFAKGLADGSAPAQSAAWQTMAVLQPVASALRALGQWSLDEAPTDFDDSAWWYRLRFDAPAGTQGCGQWLVFEGLATLATVWLNGEQLLRSTNMFVQHHCDLGASLLPQGNELLICFDALNTAVAQRKGRPQWRTPMVRQQQLRWFRTTLLGRTPGWSPPAAVVGPWRGIRLESRTQLAVQDVDLQLRVAQAGGFARCRVELAQLGEARITGVALQLTRGGQHHSTPLCAAADKLVFEGELQVPEVDLWWPHTHGEPALYAAQLNVTLADASVRTVALGQTGFRSVRVEREAGNFALHVNGVRIFCRGAVWTPLDPVTLDASPAAYEAAMAQAAQAGMNMLRVAGNMAYESPDFFAACDAHGMLVWQDFMFSNMDYPLHDAGFLESVRQEAAQQLRRQQLSPSRVLLCGNSEVAQQAAMWGAPRTQWHSAFFEEELAALCASLAPGTPYWPSSAYGGAFPHQGNAGTTSYYGVGAYLRPLEDARRSGLRFASECLAFSNVPGDAALARMPGGESLRAHHPAWKSRSPRDLGAGWDFEDVRDHYLETLFKTNARMLRYSDHARYLHLSRMASGEAMAAAFAEWRRPQSDCQGALILFLRDLWAGAGWGVVDDAGAPKACMHYLQRSLQPQAVFLSDEGCNGLFLHVVNEGQTPLAGTVTLAFWRDGEVLVGQGQCSIDLAPNAALSKPCMELLDRFADLNHAYRFGPPLCDVVVATLLDAAGATRGQAFYFPQGLSDSNQAKPGLSAQTRQIDARTTELSLQTRALALGVHFQLSGYSADDDYFHMAPGSQRTVLLSRTDARPPYGEVHAINTREVAHFKLAP